MHKIGDKVKVRLSDGKVKQGVIKDILPTLYTHTHTHTHTHTPRLLAVQIGKTEKAISEDAIL